MVMFPDFIPIDLIPMSALTALCLFFFAYGFYIFRETMNKDIKRIDTILKEHETKLDNEQETMSEMKINIALTLQSVTRMERILENETNTKWRHRTQ